MPTNHETDKERRMNWGSVIMGLVILLIAIGILYYYSKGSAIAPSTPTVAPTTTPAGTATGASP